MNDELFGDLMASVQEAGRIARGEAVPSRIFTVEREPLDVAGIREGYKLSQNRFAALLGISVKTLRNWEQGRRAPYIVCTARHGVGVLLSPAQL